MADEQGVIWGTKGADHCGIRSVFPAYPWNDTIYNTDLKKDLLFGGDADFRMSAR